MKNLVFCAPSIQANVFPVSLMRRPRSTKRPMPERLKDQAYFERRRRNNLAAKKSRDARKSRESLLSHRAASLHYENLLLRTMTANMHRELIHFQHALKCRQRFYEMFTAELNGVVSSPVNPTTSRGNKCSEEEMGTPGSDKVETSSQLISHRYPADESDISMKLYPLGENSDRSECS